MEENRKSSLNSTEVLNYYWANILKTCEALLTFFAKLHTLLPLAQT